MMVSDIAIHPENWLVESNWEYGGLFTDHEIAWFNVKIYHHIKDLVAIVIAKNEMNYIFSGSFYGEMCISDASRWVMDSMVAYYNKPEFDNQLKEFIKQKRALGV